MPTVSNRIDHILEEHYQSTVNALENHILLVVESNLALFALLLITFTAIFGLLALIAYITHLCAQLRDGRNEPR